MGYRKPLAFIHAFQANPKPSLQCRRILGGRNYCCSRHLWFYHSGRLGREESPISSSLREVSTSRFREQKHLGSRRKRLHRRLNLNTAQKRCSSLFFSFLTSLLEQEAWLVHKCCANPRHWRFVYIPKSPCQCLWHLPTFPPVTPLEE